MNRRGFLGLLAGTAGATAAGLAVPELWTPKRTFFLPPRGGWASDSLTVVWNPVSLTWMPIGSMTSYEIYDGSWPPEIITVSRKSGSVLTVDRVA